MFLISEPYSTNFFLLTGLSPGVGPGTGGVDPGHVTADLVPALTHAAPSQGGRGQTQGHGGGAGQGHTPEGHGQSPDHDPGQSPRGTCYYSTNVTFHCLN